MDYGIAFVPGIAGIDGAEWDECRGEQQDPFLSHRYLRACEESGLAAPRNGWLPAHLTVREQSGRLLAAVPIYAKGNSDDEYWIDQGWAAGYAAAGGRYYPKLLIGVPFAPVTGRRLLLHPQAPPGMAMAMLRLVETQVRSDGLSSAHLTFPDMADLRTLEEAGWLIRSEIQYEWRNRGYRDFDDFLDALTVRNRQRIRRERRIVGQSHVRFRDLSGSEVEAGDLASAIDLLNDLHRRKGFRQPLTVEFLDRISAGFGDRLTISFAEQEGEPVAVLLTVIGSDRIYVRNWGARPGLRFLHFECCYYRVIERAIAMGCRAVEGGYGGEHKLSRGFEPKLVHAAHWISDDRLRRAISESEGKSNSEIAMKFAGMPLHSPFRGCAR